MTEWNGSAVARLGLLAALCAFGAVQAVAAQSLPSEPIALADGHVTIGGDVSASAGSTDPGFFNYTDYEHSALRMLRVNVAASVRANDHLTLLAELQTENFDSVRPYALYLRIRPWASRAFDIQVGRVPPTFGAFARRTYASDNPLIGYPLAYQYLTTLRPDALPANPDELLSRRGLGWLVKYSVGATDLDHGVPVVSAFRWDTGVQMHVESGKVRATAAVTAGTISNPLFKDDNNGRQLAGRVELRPIVGLVLGSSVARGPFISGGAARSALVENRASDFTQTAWGGDVEYSRGHAVLRAETIVSQWHVPFVVEPGVTDPLRAVATSIEGRYAIIPGLYAAARVDHLGFSDLQGVLSTLPWDAAVTRTELGAGYSIQRNLLLKFSVQHNARDGGRLVTSANPVAAQVVFWF